VAAQATFFLACAFSPRKLNSCALTSCACVQVMQCGPPFTTCRRPWPRIAEQPRNPSLSGPNEGEQVGVKSLGIDLGESVATALVNLQFRALDDLCCLLGGRCNRHDLVVITVDHKRRLIDFSEVNN
jgi:hypothetical protein